MLVRGGGRPACRLRSALAAVASLPCLLLLAGSLRGRAEACAWSDFDCLAHRLRQTHVGTCNVTDIACLTDKAEATVQRIAATTQTALTEMGNRTAHLQVLGCQLADHACLRQRSSQLGAAATADASEILHHAQQAFVNVTGCALDDAPCITRRASAISAMASSHAVAVADDVSAGFVAGVGCEGAAGTDDLEACLLRRAQELSVALSIVVSTAALGALVGR
jgi:hypothetical protein